MSDLVLQLSQKTEEVPLAPLNASSIRLLGLVVFHLHQTFAIFVYNMNFFSLKKYPCVLFEDIRFYSLSSKDLEKIKILFFLKTDTENF